MSSVKSSYEPIDIHKKQGELWPAVIPPLTAIEAERAMRRLWRFSCGSTYKGKVKFATGNRRAVRFTWGEHDRLCVLNPGQGWRDLIHGLSHWFDYIVNGSMTHSKHHARFERMLVRECVKRGYLEGKLLDAEKPPATITPVYDMRVEKLRRIEARMLAWERKQKRAANALKKLVKQQRYYTKALAA